MKMRLIDADALLLAVWGAKTVREIGITPVMSVSEIQALIEAMPAVDAVPVTHGTWKWITRNEAEKIAALGIATDNENWICSVCGKHGTGRWWTHWNNYCPNCGAKMDGERREDG